MIRRNDLPPARGALRSGLDQALAAATLSPYRPAPPGPPRPSHHTDGITQSGDKDVTQLGESDAAWRCTMDDWNILKDLETEVLCEPLPVDMPDPDAAAGAALVADWTLKLSIFGPRAKECDARDYFETSSIFHRMLDLDWSRLQAKRTFHKFCPGDQPVGPVVKAIIQVSDRNPGDPKP